VLEDCSPLQQSVEFDLHPLLDRSVNMSLVGCKFKFVPSNNFFREVQQSNAIQRRLLVSPNRAGLQDRLTVSSAMVLQIKQWTHLHSLCCEPWALLFNPGDVRTKILPVRLGTNVEEMKHGKGVDERVHDRRSGQAPSVDSIQIPSRLRGTG
jgi:hypothetical protein